MGLCRNMYSLILFVFYLIFNICDTATVDLLQPCAIHDTECQCETFNLIFRTIARVGAPEYGIPILDPYYFTDYNEKLLNMLDLTLTEASVMGLKNCAFKSYDVIAEDDEGKLVVLCDIIVQGVYNFTASGGLICTIFGITTLHGSGNVRIVVDGFELTLSIYRQFKKGRDDETYLQFKIINYTYDILKNFKIFAGSIRSGEYNVTRQVVKTTNENWRILTELFGNIFISKAVEYFRLYSNRIFESIPARRLIIEETQNLSGFDGD